MKLLFLFVSLVSSSVILAQSDISGTIQDSLNRKISNVNVLLWRASDSGLVKGILTDEKGNFLFNNIQKGSYFISSTYTGFAPYHSEIFIISTAQNKDLGIINLYEKALELKEVKVAAVKPLLEQKIDRLVINVASSITSIGNSALDILEKSPGVTIDHQNNLISMNGKDGVKILINGKLSYLPADALVDLLSGMPSGNIERIELMTTPPANFDAAGNAGYINIVMKENNSAGTNGSYNLTAGYGKGLLTAAGINFNHRKGKLNIYGNISYSRKKGPFTIDTYNKIKSGGNIFEQQSSVDRKDTTVVIEGQFGLDYQFNKHTIAGILVNGYQRHFTQAEHNQSSLIKNSALDTLTTYSNHELNNWTTFSINLNTTHNFNENTTLTLNLDYLPYKNNQPVNYLGFFHDGTGAFIYEEATRTGKLTYIDIWVAALDYKTRIGKKINLESGLKQTFSGFENNQSFEKLYNPSWIKDDALSAKYRLRENYSAAYVSLDLPINPKTEAKFGLRFEHTVSNLGTETRKNIVDRQYGNLFPTVFLSHALSENNKINLSFNARINRPAFTDLAPFTYHIDAYSVVSGNPALQASITKTIKADYIYKSYLFSISYSLEDKGITDFQPELDSTTLKTTITPQNLKNQKIFSAVTSIPVNVNNWWKMQFNITGSWVQVNSLYKKAPVRLSYATVVLSGSQQFTLPKQFSLELSGFYSSNSLSGIVQSKAFGTLDIGIRKKLNEKSAVTFTGSNILNTMKIRLSTNLPELNLISHGQIIFMRAAYKVTFTHNFGKSHLKAKRERNTGAEDESGRVKHN